MKAIALVLVLYTSIASAAIARVICEDPPLEWGSSNCNGDDTWACRYRCDACMDENDLNGFRGYWRESDNQCDCYCY